MPKISAVVITYNEARNIQRCLDSVRPVTDEVIVVDAHSTDDTARIAERAGARVFTRKWDSYADAKNFGNSQATHDLILSLDADEALSEQLTGAVRAVAEGSDAGNYRFRRLTRFGDRWIRHGAWYPDIKTRLFHRQDFHWSGTVHEVLVNKNGKPVMLLDGHLLHYSYHNRNELVSRQKQYARLGAEALQRSGVKPGWPHLFFKPVFRFLRDYILRGGFLDGRSGFTIAWITARSVYWKYDALRALLRNEP